MKKSMDETAIGENSAQAKGAPSGALRTQCKRCGYEWEYRGAKKPNPVYPTYVCCPRCRIQVKLAAITGK